VADLSKKIQPTASQLQQYYTDNIAAYTKPKQWKLTYLLIPVPTHATKQQLKTAEVKLKQVVNKIKQHTDFAKLITAYSDNIDSIGKLKQGDWVVAAQLPANLRASLLNLKKSGDITTPIRIEQGYILLKLLAIKQQQVIPYQSIEAKVLEAYKLQQAEQQFANLRDQLANITYEYPNSLQPAAKKLSLSIQSTGLFTKNGEQKGIISNPKVVVAAFSDNVLQQHNNSDLIDLNDNSVVVLRVKSHIPASVKSVKEVKPFIIKQLQHKTAAKQANQLGTEIIQAIKHGQSLQQVAQKHQLELQTANNIARHDARINPAILSAVFRIAPPTKSEDTTIDGLMLPSGDYVVIALFRVSAGEKQKLTTAQLQIFQETAANNLGSLEYQLYVNGLMQKAKIKKFIPLPAS
jgi:peptidyl-prolyl cis-trans isomerase D